MKLNEPGLTDWISFDPDHEGYYGNKTETLCRKAKEAFTGYNIYPDIVLVHLGTNDQRGEL